MTEKISASQPAKPKTLLGQVIHLPFALFGVLMGSLLLSIIIEWVGLYFIWSDFGWHHAESTFHAELNALSDSFNQSMIIAAPIQMANDVLTFAYEWIFVKSGLLEQVDMVLTPKVTDSHTKLTFRQYIGVAVTHLKNYLLAAAYTTLTFIVRLFVLILSTPLIVMAVFVGFIDGLVKRDIRRFVAGHESGFIYHRARAFLLPIITLPWVIYLALPISISPVLIMLPCAIFAGIITNIATSRFKKYL